MPVSIVIGGQYGSEGKGKVAHFFAKLYQPSAVVRVGGPNSGHTVIDRQGNPVIFKQLPTACIERGIKSVLPAGNYINLDILEKEIQLANVSPVDLLIDPYAAIITEEDIQNEVKGGLIDKIGSTACGLGSALTNRVGRRKGLVFAKDIQRLQRYLADTNSFMRSAVDNGRRIIIEGTQGFGLSLLHSNEYPFSTSRDTTAAGFLSETGLSPLDVDDIIMVIRAFRIRVAGNSGPLKNETTWEKISNEAGSEVLINEFTSVTKRLRRVAYFDKEIVKRALKYNNPTKIVLNHLDYVSGRPTMDESAFQKMREFVEKIELNINNRIDYVGLNRSDIMSKSDFLENYDFKTKQDKLHV